MHEDYGRWQHSKGFFLLGLEDCLSPGTVRGGLFVFVTMMLALVPGETFSYLLFYPLFLSSSPRDSNLMSRYGEFHDQGDAKWIVIRGQLRGHNDMPFGRPTPGWPIGRPGVGRLKGVLCGFSYYSLVIFFFNVVPLTWNSPSFSPRDSNLMSRDAA
jgi:hypothetical protein